MNIGRRRLEVMTWASYDDGRVIQILLYLRHLKLLI